MRVSARTTVSAAPDAVWSALTDVDAAVAALPHATLTRTADTVAGSLRCRFGGAQVTYRVTARADVDPAEERSAMLAVTGKQARGDGTISASLHLSVSSEGSDTVAQVSGEVEATGRGADADESAWQGMLTTLLAAAAAGRSAQRPPVAAEPASPAAARAPAAKPAPTPAAASATAPTPAMSAVRLPEPKPLPWQAIAAVVVVLLGLLVRRRRHRRG